ncbi:transcript variant X2 [Nothobranchius furzeri]|uniref:Oxidized low-density lipoprotein receptor 1-like n=1 Tax=Nothobranchius furzeri TaxID=105023 RepID=A0A8C6KR78_NOTFU|nr:transcript variant X2 [Nothobranchius furzeri]
MDEEISYSSLVFKNRAAAQDGEKENLTKNSGKKNSPVPEEKQDVSIYSEVKHKALAAAASKAKEEPQVYSEVKPKAATTEPKKAGDLTTKPVEQPGKTTPAQLKVKATKRSSSPLVCLGILCLLLMAAVIFLVIKIAMVTRKQEASISELTAKNQQLNLENKNITSQTERLTVQNRFLVNKTNQLMEEKKGLENQTQWLHNQTQWLQNQTQLLQNQTQLLQNQTQWLQNQTQLLQNQTQWLQNQTQLLQNQTQLLQNKTQWLQNQTQWLQNQTQWLQNQTQWLQNQTQLLQNQTVALRKERGNLNQTLGSILTYDNFPVKDFCPNKKCQPCQTGWILFSGTCYLFYNHTSIWLTWNESRQFCQSKSADLVVINNLQEQEFISTYSAYYFDQWHGYWLGLNNLTNSKWIWIDQHEDNLKYWIPGQYGGSGPFALLVPKPNDMVPPVTQNWDTSDPSFKLRFICEQNALIISN